MFSSINFLFLTSLAITSWIILCYLNQVDRRHYTARHYQECKRILKIEKNLNNCWTAVADYGYYLNFLCIFSCTYAIAKITNFPGKWMRQWFCSSSLSQKQKLLDNIRELNQRIVDLENLNNLLQERQHNIPGRNGNGRRQVNGEDSANIFISNRHFYLNRKIVVNEVPETATTINSDSVDNWSQYLNFRGAISDKPQSNQLHEKNENANPLIVSTAQLENLHSMFNNND